MLASWEQANNCTCLSFPEGTTRKDRKVQGIKNRAFIRRSGKHLFWVSLKNSRRSRAKSPEDLFQGVAQWKVHLKKDLGNLSMILLRGLLEKQKRKRTPKPKISTHLESVEDLGMIFTGDYERPLHCTWVSFFPEAVESFLKLVNLSADTHGAYSVIWAERTA